jgi:hypothetical protein
LDSSSDFGDVVTGGGSEDATEEVEVGGALGVGYMTALTRDQLDGFSVVEGLPGGEDFGVTGVEFGVGRHGSLSDWMRRECGGERVICTVALAGELATVVIW